MTEVGLKIADIAMSLDSGDGTDFQVPEVYRAFLSPAEPEVVLQVRMGRMPKVRSGQEVFKSAGSWTLYRDKTNWILCLRSPTAAANPHQMAIFQRDFRSGEIYHDSQGQGQSRAAFPLRYPFGEVLVINLLGRDRGVLLHACGVVDRERGLLFVGTSGAGKSTLAQLWMGRADAEILSDDRVIVREREGRLWMYGTPFHGDARVASPRGVPLEQVFLIRHGPKNQFASLDPLDTSSRLLVRSFPPFWDADGMAFTVGLLANIAQSVPCHELEFVPDGSIVDFVRHLL